MSKLPQSLLILLPEMSDAGDVIVGMLESLPLVFHLVPAVALKGMHYFPYFAKWEKRRLERLNKVAPGHRASKKETVI